MGGAVHRLVVVLTGLALVGVPLASAQAEHTTGPVENGDFEQPIVPPETFETAEGTPADACIGVGHQVFFGPESAAGQATGGEAGHPNPDEGDPEAAADTITEDPEGWAVFQSGYGHCVYEPDSKGVDVAWINPVERGQQPAMWSTHPYFPSTEFGFNFDGDPFDREAKFLPLDPDEPMNTHNLWQSYVSQPGVYTANFDQLEFHVEAGEIPHSATVRLSLSGTPMDGQSPYVAGYQDCILTFTAEMFDPAGNGEVAVDPLDANLRNDPGDATEYCETAVDTFNDEEASEEERRDALGRLRIVQISFWDFNVEQGETPVVVDDVAMPGSSTVVEEAAGGNVNLDPRFDADDF